MATPLELSYQWQPPAIGATAAAVICIALLASGHADGWLPVAAMVVVVWACFVASVLVRTRAYLMVDGSRLTVRNFRDLHTIEASRLISVSEFLSFRRGPSYRLTVRDAEGRKHRYVAPTALLRSGHSTLFRWILTQAPQAELDRGSRRTVEQLQIRGLIP